MQKNAKKQWKNDLVLWRACQDRAQLARDDAAVAAMIEKLTDVKIVREAVTWARAHDIEIIVDHSTTAGGYYFVGSGVVAVSGKCLDQPWNYARVLVHEIRHAWQDYHNMIPTVADKFHNLVIAQSLMEADAYAHDRLAVARVSDFEWGRKPSLTDREILARGFDEWFSGSRAAHYFNAYARNRGHALGVRGVKPVDYNMSYRGRDVRVMADTPSATLLQRLGKTWDNKNYLSDHSRDDLFKRKLSAQFALRAFKKRLYRQNSLVREIRKRELRARLGKAGPRC